MRNGVGLLKTDLPAVLANDGNDLTATMRQIVTDMRADLGTLESRIKSISDQIKAMASRDDTVRRLTSIPGIDQLGATAILAAVGDAKRFRKGRDMAAWLGLVPAQYSTGDKPQLLGISKRGNSYLRKLLIHGARTCIMHLDRTRDRLGVWLDGLDKRIHRNKATVALANKLARIAWVILTRPGTTYERQDPRFV